jgi:type I restriction enzyme R subunit
MNEAETRAELIDTALKAAGWGVVEASRVRREVITLGRLQGAGMRSAQASQSGACWRPSPRVRTASC